MVYRYSALHWAAKKGDMHMLTVAFNKTHGEVNAKFVQEASLVFILKYSPPGLVGAIHHCI